MRGFHDRRPGATAAAYGAGQGPDGRSSYQVLADLCGVYDRVLDLGAGDGYLLDVVRARRGDGREGLASDAQRLVAVDLSLGELRAAGARSPGLPRVLARAQRLPFAASTFDIVLSHLAFTLMADPDAIAAELARVLGPGGRFAAIVGGGPRGDDAFAGFLDLARPYFTSAATITPTPRLGDRRARTDDGLAALFAPATGFTLPTITDLPIDLSGSPDEVWSRLEPAYELAALPPDARADLHAAFLAAAPRWRRADGLIGCTMATRLVIATRTA